MVDLNRFRAQRVLLIPSLRSPGFPVKTRGFEGLHAALLKESRTPGRRMQREVEIRVRSGRDDKGRAVTHFKDEDWDVK